ncbi:MAG: P-loop NTPase [Nitrosomonas sp.]|nr:P-loop NTPase [Nitrosomonas sp.]
MLIGLLIDVETPMVWRGLMVTQALQQLLNDTRWHDSFDYLVIDLPPGTGDIQLTLAQKNPGDRCGNRHHAADRLRLTDARKGLKMFEKV